MYLRVNNFTKRNLKIRKAKLVVSYIFSKEVKKKNEDRKYLLIIVKHAVHEFPCFLVFAITFPAICFSFTGIIFFLYKSFPQIKA